MAAKRWFFLITLLQMLFLIGLAGTSYAAIWFGKEVRLATAPVDPRDILYGDYVTLSYEMSRLSPELWQGKGDLPKRGDVVYVVLRSDAEGMYAPAAFDSRKPAAAEGEAVIKGIVQYRWAEEVVVRYGLERYYVPEGTGKALEEEAGNLIVTVNIAPWGQAVITGVESAGS